MSSQININNAFEQDLVEVKMTYPKDILVLKPCLHHNPINNTIRCVGQEIYKYPEILQVICNRSNQSCLLTLMSDNAKLTFRLYSRQRFV